eukprot:132906-Alexandrium_andersonii.AAC.1
MCYGHARVLPIVPHCDELDPACEVLPLDRESGMSRNVSVRYARIIVPRPSDVSSVTFESLRAHYFSVLHPPCMYSPRFPSRSRRGAVYLRGGPAMHLA